MATATLRTRTTRPAPVPDAPACSPLPSIDGAGLSRTELARVTRARNVARAIYAADMPEGSPAELDRVADAAATDALRSVLKGRPAASPPAPCCDADEAAPCQSCSPTPTVRRSPAAPRGTCRLSLVINGITYGVRPVRCDPGTATQCFELRKPDGTVYHVARHEHGAECDCSDFIFNRQGKDELGCKHIRALVALGILDTRPARVLVPPPSAFDDEPEPPAASWPAWTDGTRYALTR